MDRQEKVIVGIMQPYFFPYIGYWQLMNAVDKYVIYDDVNYIKRGWINRNRILVNNEVKYVNVPVLGASQNKLINEIQVNPDENEVDKTLRLIEMAYKNAPYFETVFPLVETVMHCKKGTVSEFIAESFRCVCDYLDIKTELIMSSDIEKDNSLRGEDKIIDICKRLGATDYYNAVGGQELYDYKHFSEIGMQLHFLKTEDIKYKQFDADFESGLSIIDVMMFNSKEEIKEMLKQYSLIEE